MVTEEHRDQCYGKCGNLNKQLGGAKVYRCAKCDGNAARGLFQYTFARLVFFPDVLVSVSS